MESEREYGQLFDIYFSLRQLLFDVKAKGGEEITEINECQYVYHSSTLIETALHPTTNDGAVRTFSGERAK